MVSNSSTFTLNMTESVKVGFKELIEKDRFEKNVSASGIISPRPPPPWKRTKPKHKMFKTCDGYNSSFSENQRLDYLL